MFRGGNSHKLKPCPFCGGTQDGNGVIDHDERCFVTLFADVFLIGNVSKKEIETAWNTRAYDDGEPMTEENMARHGWKRERTCKNLEYDPPWFTCSECSFVSVTEWLAGGSGIPNYCPNCGARVVEVSGHAGE